jgi:tetratricopeptide (TPR) repeat protein
MELDNDNLSAALEYAIHLHDSRMALRLGAAVWRFWQYRGHVDEGRRWLKLILDLPDITAEDDISCRGKVLQAAGALARIQGDFTEAQRFYEKSLALRRQSGDVKGVAAVLNSLGLLSMGQGKYAEAAACMEESLQICRQLDIQSEIVMRLNNLGVVAMYQGDYEKASSLHEESRNIHQEMNDHQGVAGSLGNLGDVLRYQGEHDRAMEVLEESLAILQEIGDVHGTLITLASIGRVHLAKGNAEQALAAFHASLMLNQQVGDIAETINSLEGIAEGLGMFARRSPLPQGRIRQAVRLLSAADRLRSSAGAPCSAAERAEYDRITALLRSQLLESDFELEWKRGAEMTTQQAAEFALSAFFVQV